jgi:predicted Zn-dependent peptidase
VSPRILALGVAVVAGCATGGAPRPLTGVVIPVRDTAPSRPEKPPPSRQALPHRFPQVVWGELANGLEIATIPGANGPKPRPPAEASPSVQVRVVVGAGQAADGERPGLAALTAQLLGEGTAGETSSRLRADLSIETSFDATTVGLAVTPDHLGEALDLLGAVVQRPQLSPADLEKLKAREASRLAGAARTQSAWSAKTMLFRDLFSLPSEHHPYATWSATPAEIERLTVADCRAFHRRFFVPRNTFVVVAGDATPEAARALVQKAFGSFHGAEPPAISFTDPMPPEARKITIVDRPQSSQSEVFVGALGPAPTDRAFAAFAVASQILGGDTAVTVLAHGPSVLLTHASTQAATTGIVLASLLDHLDRLAGTVPSPDEVEAAQRDLARTLAVRVDTLETVADELARLHTLGLPDDHDDAYRRELGEITPALVLKAAGDHLRSGHEVIVVAGDAALIGPALSRFGEVKVVDPTRDFARERTLPMDTNVPHPTPEPEAEGAAAQIVREGT